MTILTMGPIAVGETTRCGDCTVTRFPADDGSILFEVNGPRNFRFTFDGEFGLSEAVKVHSLVGSSSGTEIHAQQHTHLHKNETYGYWYSSRFGSDTWLYRDAEASMFRSTPVGGKTEQKVKDIVSAILTATAPEFSKQVALKEAEYELERATKAVEEARKAVEAARALETEARLTLIDAQISLESVSVYFPD